MKYYTITITLACSILLACKTKKNTIIASTAKNKITAPAADKTMGVVSHRFRTTGCSTIIIIPPQQGQKDTLVLIPKDTLPNKFDADKTKISFQYRTLRIPQPHGCNQGIPAEITNIAIIGN